MLIVLAFSFLFSWQANGSFSDMAMEYLDKNSDIRSSKLDVDASKWSVTKLKGQKYFFVKGSGSFQDSKLESSSSFSQNPMKVTSYDLSVGKNFNWGGTLSLTNAFSLMEQSGGFSSLFGTSGEYSSFGQKLSYTQDLGQDLLGRTYKSQIEMAEQSLLLAKRNYGQKENDGLLNLGMKYIQGQLRRELLENNKEALKRSVKRKKLVSKRVKDGLREQVDLMQAQMTEISAKEAVKSAQNEFTTVLEEIAVILHRPVLENDIKTFSKESFSPVAGSLDQNLVFASMKAKEQLQELSLKNAENSIMPTVTLEASYETNNYDLSSGEAISGGRLGEDNDVWKLGLNATWAIGLESERSEKEIQSIERQKAIYQLGKVSRNNLQLEKSFKSKLAVLEQNLKSAAKRNELAHKVLKEYNRLYSRGRASLDQVINAEEELIRTQSDYARYRAQYGTLVLRMHNLYGILKREVLK